MTTELGESRGQLAEAIGERTQRVLCDSLESAVEAAFRLAEEGTTVALLPGCASFDMFRDQAFADAEQLADVLLGLRQPDSTLHYLEDVQRLRPAPPGEAKPSLAAATTSTRPNSSSRRTAGSSREVTLTGA